MKYVSTFFRLFRVVVVFIGDFIDWTAADVAGWHFNTFVQKFERTRYKARRRHCHVTGVRQT